ncbi:MAG: choloylglycine hydrolase [Bacteroidales bacterium]|nr:choloylglycine hydrolase [Bacteroidales bacterium]
MHNEMAVRRKTIKRILLVLVLCLVAFLLYFILVAVDHPPEVQDLSSLDSNREQHGKYLYTLGNNWLRKSESGLWEMYIEGESFERGVAFGKLTKELLYYQESAFFEQIQELVPSQAYLKFLKYFLAWFNRNLDKNITDEYRTEIYGTSFSCSHEFDFIGSGYQRQLNYHAAHDIGHALQGLNMVGCTSFACWGSKSADSTLLVGRNFDFYAGKKFAENKIICFYNPSDGYRFMMVSWADMIGVVSGMNEKGLTVTINAAKSAVPRQASTPVTLLAREILQYAANLDEAYTIAGKRKLFVSESLLIGSVKDGKSAIIEKSPHQEDMFSVSADCIVCANHFQGKVFSHEKANISNIKGSDSRYRYDRVKELLQNDTRIDVNDAVAILRDRYGKGGVDLGMGNPMAVNQLIAHHSVVFKPGQQMVWVSTSPYQIGKYVAYDLKRVFSLDKEQIITGEEICVEEMIIPADTFLFSDEYQNYKKYLQMTEELKFCKKNKTALPDSFLRVYLTTNPHLYLPYYYLGSYFYEMKDYARAYDYYQAALSKEVAGLNKRNEIIKLSEKTYKKIHNANTGN